MKATDVIARDHRAVEALFGKFKAAAETVTGPNEERVERIMEKVFAHAKKEEDLIFSMAEIVLGADMLEEFGEKMEPVSAVALAGTT